MKNSLYLFTGLVLCAVFGCNNSPDPSNTDGALAAGEDPNLCKGAGCMGASCTKASDCTEGEGGAAVCWLNTLLENPSYVATPGGYCTRRCQADSECGTGKCVSVPNSTDKYCMASCRTSLTCRKPGYSCAFNGDVGGICFPHGTFDCNPTTTKGTCDFGPRPSYAGGCIRVAYEDEKGGVCHLACRVGTKTCPPDTRIPGATPPDQLCAYIDTMVDAMGNPAMTKDKWKGAVCFGQPTTPVADNGACVYWTDCADGSQCDRYGDKTCRKLCAQGNGMQDGNLYVPPGAMPANNTCAAGSCGNGLRAGTIDGAPGLCK